MPDREPRDHTERQAIGLHHDRTLFVDAGAGSGKTTALVDRLLRLVRDSGVEIERIAAITFTDAAAAELRTRVREALEGEVRGGSDADARCQKALDALDDAAILTLHSFAQRILSRHPVEAGLPPAVEIHDEVTSVLGFEERWAETVQRLLDDETLAEVVHLGLALGLTLDSFEAVARQLDQNWDLLESLDLDLAVPTLEVDPSPVIAWYERALHLRAALPPDVDDKLAAGLDEAVAPWVEHLRTVTDRFELLDLLADLPKIHGNWGSARVWGEAKADVHAALAEAKASAEAVRHGVADAVLTAIGSRIARHVLEAAEDRRRSGRLEFHDLLVLARRLVRRCPEVRSRLHERYARLLIDEFQDTDPIQVELAVRIAAADDHPEEVDWRQIPVPAGRLFFVGDGNQSIYRFRRADPQIYAEVREHVVDAPTRLHVNFRSVPGVLDVVNAVFAEAAGETSIFAPLDAHREPLPGHGGPAVMRFGEPDAAQNADGLREAEAEDVARAIRTATTEQWLVHDDTGSVRDATLSDITILIPARTSLPHLERVLAAHDIPYRIETGTLIYSTAEIQDLVLVLGAIADPADAVSVAGALRSPAYGCGDDDLFTWHEAGGTWSYLAPSPAVGDDHPVAVAMADLRQRHNAHVWQTVSETVEEVVRERRLMEAALLDGRHRDIWRRYRVVLEHARRFADDGSGHLRDFLRWVELQRSDTIRPSVPVLPERDLNAVRIMTIHGAKGLEFPIAIVSGVTKEKNKGRRGPQVILDEGSLHVRMRKGIQTGEFEARQVAEDQMDEEERLRLLYVALTRARDHLVVSTHHKSPGPTASGFTCHGHLLWHHLHERDDVRALEPPVPASDEGSPVRVTTAEQPPPDPDVAGFESMGHTIDERQRRFADPGGLGAVAATAVGALLRPGEPHRVEHHELMDRPPWRRGRAGTAIGRATHAVLQHVDLGDVDDPDLPALARHQATLEGVPGAAGEVEAKARAALSHPVVREAAAAPRLWREVPVAAPIHGMLLEGFVDLLFEGPAGLVVVDHKTDAVRSQAELEAARERYAPQGAAYALALEEATGCPVERVVFLFLRAHEAIAAEVPDLDAAVADVRARLGRLEADADAKT